MGKLTKRTIMANDAGVLKCTVCGVEKPLTEFYRRSDGNIRSRCKACEMAAQKRFRDDNPELCKARKKAYDITHKEQIDAYNHRYAATHSAENVARMKRWEAANPDRAKELKQNALQRRLARKKGLAHTFTTKDWADCLEYFDHRCAYCGVRSDDLTREHVIPLSKGGPYTKDNIIPACGICNSRKFNTDIWQWYRVQEFYTPERESKIREYLSHSAC